jgi:small-conductance mechanosensitive channel
VARALFQSKSRDRGTHPVWTVLSILLLAAAAAGAGYLLFGIEVERPALWIAAAVVIAVVTLGVVLFGVYADRREVAREREYSRDLEATRRDARELRHLTRELVTHGNRRRAPRA